MNTAQRVLKNIFSISISEVASRLAGVILTIYIARTLGAGVFGQLAFAMAFVAFFNIFADFGLTGLGIREIARDKSRTSSYGTNILVLQLGLSIILLVILSIILLIIPLDPRIKLITFLFGLGMIPSALNMSYIFQAHEKMEYFAISRIIAQISYVIFGFILIYLFRDILVLPIINFIALFIATIVAFYLLRRQINFVWSKINLKSIISLSKQTLPFFVATLMVQIYMGTDSVMLQFMKGEEVVGLYNAAYKIVFLLLLIAGFLNGAIFPLMSVSYKNNREYFNKLIKFYARILGLLIIPIAIGGFIFAKEIIILLYGQSYTGSILALSILIFIPVFMFINVAMGSALVNSGNERTVTNSAVIAAILNLVLNFLLIPSYSLYGAAVATIIALIVTFIYCYFAQRIILKIDILSIYFFKPLIASFLMAIALYFLPENLFVLVKIGIGIPAYVMALFIIRGIQLSDIHLIKQVLSKSKAKQD